MLNLKTIDFGKYKGKRWEELPLSYLNWLTLKTKREYQRRAVLEIEKRASKEIKENK